VTTAAVAPAGEFTTEEHWRFMAEFVREEQALGGPDPHLATLGPMLRDCDYFDKIWRCLLYASGYNIPLAEAIWTTWPWERATKDRSGLEAWVNARWGNFTLRRERRAVRTPVKFNRMLQSMLDWSLHTETHDLMHDSDSFEAAWASTGKIYGLGRYVQQKLIEALCRHAGAKFNQDDIRAKDGTSPREGLALLFPGNEPFLLRGGNGPVNLHIVEDLADRVKLYLDNSKTPVDYFQLQVILCEYKKSWQGKQYPGRTHDTELRYWRDARQKWGDFGEAMLAARAEVFPREILGEENGWWRQREELEAALPVFRYTWSDRLYDYWNGTVDNPMPR
jgi:amino acid-DNA transferase-like protein